MRMSIIYLVQMHIKIKVMPHFIIQKYKLVQEEKDLACKYSIGKHYKKYFIFLNTFKIIEPFKIQFLIITNILILNQYYSKMVLLLIGVTFQRRYDNNICRYLLIDFQNVSFIQQDSIFFQKVIEFLESKINFKKSFLVIIPGGLFEGELSEFDGVIMTRDGRFDNNILYFEMQAERIAPTEGDVLSFIYTLKTGSLEEIKKQIDTYTPEIVSRLQMQSRQPALYFAALISDHDKAYEVMRMLIEAGANPFYKDYYQQTVIFYVCRQGNEKCLELLIQKGLDSDEVDTFGQTPIYYVARENRLNLFNKLVDKADLNRIDKIANQTPLFYAAKQGHLEMCKLLIENGCDVGIQDSTHKTALHYAKVAGKTEVLDYLTAQLYKNRERRRPNNENKVSSSKPPPVVQQAPSETSSTNGKNHTTVQKPPKKKEAPAPPPPPPPPAPAPPKITFKLVKTDSNGNSNEVPAEELKEIYKVYPDLEKLLGNPDALQQAQIDDLKQKDNWQKAANKVLGICWKAKGGYVFHNPVDPKKFGIDDYFEVVKNPMDFSTIKKKLQNGSYKAPDGFVQDMQLIFSNCILYNGADNPVSKCAIEMKDLFESSCRSNGVPLS